MSNVTLSVVVPSIEIIFDDDTAAILTAVDADTVLGVTPGAVGLLVLAATTGDGVLSVIGGASVVTAASMAQNAVMAHASQRNPHREYATQAQLDQIVIGNGAAVAAHAASRSAHPDRPTFDQSILLASFFGG